MQRFILGLFFMIGMFSCATTAKKDVQLSQAQQIIDSAIKAHGGKKYDQAAYEFDFRKKHYSFDQADGKYEYRLSQSKNGVKINARLNNTGYSQTNNGTVVEMSEADQRRYGDALNSVIYFAQLPYRLNDPAVKKSYHGKGYYQRQKL